MITDLGGFDLESVRQSSRRLFYASSVHRLTEVAKETIILQGQFRNPLHGLFKDMFHSFGQFEFGLMDTGYIRPRLEFI